MKTRILDSNGPLPGDKVGPWTVQETYDGGWFCLGSGTNLNDIDDDDMAELLKVYEVFVS